MPVKARIDTLTTGVRTPVGIKIGPDLTTSVFEEQTAGGYSLDFSLKREELARYGLSLGEAEMVIMSAVAART